MLNIQKKISKQSKINNILGINGDNGVSFYSTSSYNDSSILDTTTIYSTKAYTKALKTPIPSTVQKPPNNKLIHFSLCKNDKCPLQHVWKN